MAIPLLQTKFHIPQARPGLVARPRLIERLNAGLGRKLTLVSAPAGFGKTTLIGEWVSDFGLGIADSGLETTSASALRNRQSAIGNRVAWLSLDGGDGDLTRFLAYLVGALQRLPSLSEADVGQAALAMLDAAQPQPPPVASILTALINDLAAAEPVLLVLDDYHLIESPPVHDATAFLLEHMPANLHLVIVTRADPPLPIARLRGRGQLVELRQANLRFTPAEAAGFLNQVMGLDLAGEDVAALEARTEGWIVGLQLAALSLQGRADPHAFIAAFGGGHHYVLEYLTEEVVRRQPEPVQRFLIETSILNRLCGPLVDALTGEREGEAMLADLWQRNLFILPLDDEHRWYRYHHLFADLLANLLRKQEPPARIRDLHLCASAWYEGNGPLDEAVRHALAAPDLDRAARLIERHSLDMVIRGELTTLLRWIAALPADVARSRPWLCIHEAWPLVLAGREEDAELLLQQVEERVSPDEGEILGHVATMRALAAVMRGDMARAVEQAHRAGDLLPADNLSPRHIIPYALASAHRARGELTQAEQALRDELRLGQAAGNLWTIVRALCDRADVLLIQGRLGEALDLCQEALGEAEARGARQFGTVGFVLVKLGELLHARGDLPAAADHIAEGVALMQAWRQPYEMVSGYTALAAIRQAQGDPQGALEALDRAEQIRSRHPRYFRLHSMVALCRIRLSLARNEAETADRQAREARLGETGDLVLDERERIALARVHIARQRWDAALSLLAHLAPDAEAGERFGHLIEILSLQAVALQGRGEHAPALAALEKALAIGAPEGFVRAFVELGAPMTNLLQQAAVRGIAPGYIAQLLAAQGKEIETPSPDQVGLVEPLTERELEVLALIGAGYSNRRIAQALVISLNTVKKHASSIYGKLGVRSRTQAVARAQELDLL